MHISDGLICSSGRRILTETETQLISQKRFKELVEQQKKIDDEIDAKLTRQEDDLRVEEEVCCNTRDLASALAILEKFSNDCRKTTSKVSSLMNQHRQKQAAL